MAIITIQAIADIDDSMINLEFPNNNYGTNAVVNIGEQNSGTRLWRVPIKFDLSGIPSGSTVNSATLSIRATSDLSDNTRTYRVYRLKRAWVVGEVTWNIYSTGNSWQTAGGSGANDREGTDIGSRSFTATETLNVFKDFTLTASKVQEMITGGVFTNSGFMLQADTENNDMYEFNSSDNGTEANNPKLVIDYTSPSGFLAIL